MYNGLNWLLSWHQSITVVLWYVIGDTLMVTISFHVPFSFFFSLLYLIPDLARPIYRWLFMRVLRDIAHFFLFGALERRPSTDGYRTAFFLLFFCIVELHKTLLDKHQWRLSFCHIDLQKRRNFSTGKIFMDRFCCFIENIAMCIYLRHRQTLHFSKIAINYML